MKFFGGVADSLKFNWLHIGEGPIRIQEAVTLWEVFHESLKVQMRFYYLKLMYRKLVS